MTEFFQDAHAQDHNRAVSLLANDQYWREVHWIPCCEREERAQLVEQVKRGLAERSQPLPNQSWVQQAQQARTRLVESYQALIASFAVSFARSSARYEMLDFVNDGTIGFLLFLDRLDAYEDLTSAAFHTLAISYIRGEMLQGFRYRNGVVRLPDYIQRVLKQFERVEHELFEASGREPTYHEIAHVMQVSLEKVVELVECRRQRRLESLEGLLENVDGDECLDFVSVFEMHAQRDETRAVEMSEAIQAAIATVLTRKQQEVVQLRYGFGEGPCQLRLHGEVASLLGVAESSAHRTDGRAKERLSRALAPVVESRRVDEWSA